MHNNSHISLPHGIVNRKFTKKKKKLQKSHRPPGCESVRCPKNNGIICITDIYAIMGASCRLWFMLCILVIVENLVNISHFAVFCLHDGSLADVTYLSHVHNNNRAG